MNRGEEGKPAPPPPPQLSASDARDGLDPPRAPRRWTAVAGTGGVPTARACATEERCSPSGHRGAPGPPPRWLHPGAVSLGGGHPETVRGRSTGRRVEQRAVVHDGTSAAVGARPPDEPSTVRSDEARDPDPDHPLGPTRSGLSPWRRRHPTSRPLYYPPTGDVAASDHERDDALVRACRAAHPTAFAEIVDRHQGWMWRVAPGHDLLEGATPVPYAVQNADEQRRSTSDADDQTDRSDEVRWVPPAGFEPATHGLGSVCPLPL